MSIEKLTENVEIIQTLGTFPNQDDGLTPEELKKKFDEGAKVIKDYLNDVVVPAVNDALNKPGTPGPAGPQGEQGVQGEDGYSPQVRVSEMDFGYRVEIDYRDEEQDGALVTARFDVKGGKDAPQEAILFTPQPDLSEEEKAQARENIGISDNPDVHAEYFQITEDGVLSLKPEYRGEPTDETFPDAASDEGVGEAGSCNAELPEQLVIPETVDGIAVNSIADGAFAYNMVIKSVAFPKTLDTIPEECFRDCHNLEKVTNTENIKVVDNSAFRMTVIKSADFPNLETLGEYAFFMCSCLTHVNIGKATSIGKAAFATCYRLSSVQSGNRVESVGEAAFSKASGLVNASFVENLTSIDDGAFIGCGLDFDWSTLGLPASAFGTNATPLQWNPDDFWSKCTSEKCKNPLPTLLCQEDPRWKDIPIGGTPGAKPYSQGCTLFSLMHAYCGLNNLHLSTVFEFEDIVNEIVPGILSNYEFLNELNGTQLEDAEFLAEDLGLAVTSYRVFNSETLQAFYDALASGKYIMMTSAADGLDGDMTGHAALAYGLTGDREIGDKKINGKIRIADSGASYRTDPSKGGYVYKLPAKVACYNVEMPPDLTRDLPLFCVIEKPETHYYYSTLITAVTDANNGTLGANANADASSAVAEAYIKNGKPCVILRKDTVEATSVEPSVDMTINLGGHILSANNSVGVNVKGGNLTIDGRRPGSAIKQEQSENAICVQTSMNEYTVSLTVLGGTYSSVGGRNAYGFFLADADTNVELSGCEITAQSSGTNGTARGIYTCSNVAVRHCNIDVNATSVPAFGVDVVRSSEITVEMNDCNIEGTAATFTPMNLNLDASSGETENVLKVSNSTIPEGSVITIESDTHKLYIGKGNNFTAENTDRPGSVVVEPDKEYAQLG